MMGFILEIPRLFLGVLLTALLIPVVGLIHLLFYFKAKKLRSQVNNLKVKINIEGEEKDQTFEEFNKSLDSYSSSLMEIKKIDSPDTVKNALLVERLPCFGIYSKNIHEKLLATIDINEKNEDGIKALLGTNTGDISRLLEKDKKLDEVKELLNNPKNLRKIVIDGMSKSERNESAFKAFASDPLYDKNLSNLIFSHAGINHSKSELREHKDEVAKGIHDEDQELNSISIEAPRGL
jgi:hypothetical protein